MHKLTHRGYQQSNLNNANVNKFTHAHAYTHVLWVIILKTQCSKFIFFSNICDNYSLFFVFNLLIWSFFPCICNFVCYYFIKLCNVGLLPHVCLAVKSGVTCNIHMIHIHSSNVMIQILKKRNQLIFLLISIL